MLEVILILLFMLVIAGFLIWWEFRREKKLTPQQYEQLIPPRASFEFRQFHPIVHFNSKNKTLEAQSSEWLRKMFDCGSRISNSGVRKIMVVHGTFVGDDPLDLFRLVEKTIPSMEGKTRRMLGPMLNKLYDTFLVDMGNFHEAYIKIFEQALGNHLTVESMTWSSANHHLARLKGAVDLIVRLADMEEVHVLLMGHSHAGQLFSLTTQLVNGGSNRGALMECLKEAGPLPEEFEKKLEIVKKMNLDFVTLGTPPRYAWMLSSRNKLIHLVNHRGSRPIAGRLSGMLTTRDGDYIQQLGIAGSDSLAMVKEDREINLQLNELLGIGRDFQYWRSAIRNKKRLHEAGRTLLIDYRDQGFVPNAHKTIFGHGNYTRFNVMLFNTTCITQELY